ncbi:hypothetical protein C0580_04545 [Candidatus Parcubacteria bacterium]|nr:MAG: hypothetical protein C0580_04545 [Candidatus Parcubacteria bacterium]
MENRALLSVSNKRGIVEFARGLVLLGYEIVSTGGTARVLREDDIEVTEVSELTQFPEILGGRVKTLHPAVHAGILAKDSQAHEDTMTEMKLPWFDLVVVNFYPFENVIDQGGVTRIQAIENIDIGGPAMARAAAKNADRVTVIIDPNDYDKILAQLQDTGKVDWGLRQQLQLKVFERTSSYDSAVAKYLSGRHRQSD